MITCLIQLYASTSDMYKTRHNSIYFSDIRRFNIKIYIKRRYVFWSQYRAQRLCKRLRTLYVQFSIR